jgi:hypothetical protein
MEIPYS